MGLHGTIAVFPPEDGGRLAVANRPGLGGRR